MPDYQEIEPHSRAEWREWLADNHSQREAVFLIMAKKDSGLPSLTYAEAVEEALCFGWIDSVANKLDDQRWKQVFSPRKKGSGWSRLNKTRVKSLTQQGLMTKPGLDAIKRAKADGSWAALDQVEKLAEPKELKTALKADKEALKNWKAFAPSSKKGILQFIASAKTEPTKNKRIEATVRMASKGLRAFFDKE